MNAPARGCSSALALCAGLRGQPALHQGPQFPHLDKEVSPCLCPSQGDGEEQAGSRRERSRAEGRTDVALGAAAIGPGLLSR